MYDLVFEWCKTVLLVAVTAVIFTGLCGIIYGFLKGFLNRLKVDKGE